MSVETTKASTLFYCYARADKALRDELDLYLTSLKRQNLIMSWYEGVALTHLGRSKEAQHCREKARELGHQ